MARHTKNHNKAFEKMAIREISKVLGEPKPWNGDNLEWEMPHGSGRVTLHLICESKKKGSRNIGSWLACRLDNDDHLNDKGYTLPRDQIPGGWPYAFTYPSGKCNLHILADQTEEELLRDLARHLYSISEEGSEYKEKFGEIEFETDTPAPGMR